MGGSMSAPPSQQATRHARRVYVGGLPPTATEQSIAQFFSSALAAIGGNSAGPGANLINHGGGRLHAAQQHDTMHLAGTCTVGRPVSTQAVAVARVCSVLCLGMFSCVHQ